MLRARTLGNMLGFWGRCSDLQMHGRDANARHKDFWEDGGILGKVLGFWGMQDRDTEDQTKDLGKLVGFVDAGQGW